MENVSVNKKRFVGTVVSAATEKTCVVEVKDRVRHPIYQKYFTRTKRFMAHDAADTCAVGDVVRIVESRPLSKRKRWAVEQITEKFSQD